MESLNPSPSEMLILKMKKPCECSHEELIDFIALYPFGQHCLNEASMCTYDKAVVLAEECLSRLSYDEQNQCIHTLCDVQQDTDKAHNIVHNHLNTVIANTLFNIKQKLSDLIIQRDSINDRHKKHQINTQIQQITQYLKNVYILDINKQSHL